MCSRPPRSPTIVGSAVETIVWSSDASSITSIRAPMTSPSRLPPPALASTPARIRASRVAASRDPAPDGYGGRSPSYRRTACLAVALGLLGPWALLPVPASGQSESTLRDRIERSREREGALSGAIAALDRMLARVGREVAIVQGRLDEVEQD